MKKSALISCSIVLVVCLYACTHKPGVIPTIPKNDTTAKNNNNNNNTQDTTQQMVDTSVCFQRDILPIFLGSCAISGCHDASTQEKGYNLTSYSNIIRKGLQPYYSASSKLYTECVSGKMPAYPIARLDSTQLSLLKHWIDMGAHNDTNCSVICDTTKFTYAAAIVPILKNNCYSCHATAAAPSSGGGIVLDNYIALTVQVQNGKLLGDLQHQSGYNYMPLGGNKLQDCQITQVRRWIANGAPNN
ncbi:MAG: hypothetical protein P4L41_13530 [Flavipsychrobacter sp.]|nr:hypothetical protein [Flavipsychrobacter sp.]